MGSKASVRLRSRPASAAVGLLIAWGLALSDLPEALSAGAAIDARVGRELIWWSFGAAVIAWIIIVEKLPLRSIGLRRPNRRSLLWGCLFVVPLMGSVMLCYAVLFPLLGLKQNMSTTRSIIAVPLWLQVSTMLRAGVVEEILFRGYPIERLTLLTSQRWLAALLAGAVFIAAHDVSIVNEWLVNAGRRDARTRLAHLICELSMRHALMGGNRNDLRIGLKQAHLADASGISPVHVNRMLAELRDAELLTPVFGGVRIDDWNALAQLGEFDPTYLQL